MAAAKDVQQITRKVTIANKEAKPPICMRHIPPPRLASYYTSW